VWRDGGGGCGSRVPSLWGCGRRAWWRGVREGKGGGGGWGGSVGGGWEGGEAVVSRNGGGNEVEMLW
jgi:hypothetical protein